MKSKILTYGLVFSILLIVFQYVNSKSIIEKYELDIQKCKDKSEKLESENLMLKRRLINN